MSNVLLNSLYKYYDEKNVKKLLEVLEEDTKVSLRSLIGLLQTIQKKHIFYTIYKTESGKNTFNPEGNNVLRQFNTYHSYKAQLKSYSKKGLIHFVEGKELILTVRMIKIFLRPLDN